MRFSIGGDIFITDHLSSFVTGDPARPVIYLDTRSARVFIEVPDKYQPFIKEVDGAAFESLCQRYRLDPLIDQLLGALPPAARATVGPDGSPAARARQAREAMDAMRKLRLGPVRKAGPDRA